MVRGRGLLAAPRCFGLKTSLFVNREKKKTGGQALSLPAWQPLASVACSCREADTHLEQVDLRGCVAEPPRSTDTAQLSADSQGPRQLCPLPSAGGHGGKKQQQQQPLPPVLRPYESHLAAGSCAEKREGGRGKGGGWKKLGSFPQCSSADRRKMESRGGGRMLQ